MAVLNLFLRGKNETSKNALREVYYNLTWQALSNEYIDYVVKFDVISDLTAEINLELQKAIRSNKLKREDKENFKKETDDIFVFKEKKSDFKNTENELSKAT